MTLPPSADMACAEVKNQNSNSSPMPLLPIESAPKDGSKLLLCFPIIGWVCGSWDDDEYSKRPKPYWTCDKERAFGRMWVRGNQPIYWTHLPPEPPDMQDEP